MSSRLVSAVTMRYIIWSDKLGAWLGDGYWSKKDHGGRDRAPTFTNEITLANVIGVGVEDARICQVYPSNIDLTAQREDIVEAGMEGWDPLVAIGS